MRERVGRRVQVDYYGRRLQNAWSCQCFMCVIRLLGAFLDQCMTSEGRVLFTLPINIVRIANRNQFGVVIYSMIAY